MKEFFRGRIKDFAMVLALVLSAIYVTAPVHAGTCSGGLSEAACNQLCNDGSLDEQQKAAAGCDISSSDQLPKRAQNIINAVISVVGILAILVIAVAGQRFLSSGGDPGKVKQARDMVLYAAVALVVAGLAYAIVAFISSNVASNANTDTH